MTQLEQYQLLLSWLQHPRFDSVEEGRAAATLNDEQPYTYFIVQRTGAYVIHRAYLQRGEVASQADLTISMVQLDIAKERAVRELGEARLAEIGL